MKNPTQPCSTCPFRKTVQPGALGGSPVEVYLGQAMGPFHVPCHSTIDYSDPDWKAKAFEYPQCAGMAAFRVHIGTDKLMPVGIHRVPANDQVFATSYDFTAHHEGEKEARKIGPRGSADWIEWLKRCFHKECVRSGLVVKEWVDASVSGD